MRTTSGFGALRTGVRGLAGSRRRLLQIVLPTLVALGVGVAFAAGAIPGSDGTITGCYANQTDGNGNPQPVVIDNVAEVPGALRVIDPSKPAMLPSGGINPAGSCVPGESQITWNQSGPQGPTGQTGATGVSGAQGVAGAAGATGAAGTSLLGETTLGLSPAKGTMFLEIEGIEGESTDDKHKGEIEIESFALSASGNGTSSQSTGAGKVDTSSLHFTKKIDKASPLLMQAAVTGKAIPSAKLYFTHKVGGQDETYLELDFQNLRLASVSDGTSGNASPTEALSLNYSKVEMTYIGSNGKPGQSIRVNVGSTLKP
jgi:type VI secretion system secreted protein Hcp